MFAGVPSSSPSAASTSDAVAASAALRTTSTPVISGSVAPAQHRVEHLGGSRDGVWWTINSVGTAPMCPLPLAG